MLQNIVNAILGLLYTLFTLLFSGYVAYYGLQHFVYPVVPPLYHFTYPVVIGLRVLIGMSLVSEIDIKDALDNPSTFEHKFATQGAFLIALGVMWVIVNYYI